ncbi:hypothetical protein AB0G04_34805 [Actinoplanes sp. NPDC023801]|uniref:hypothetical protein n=1 Tax=Actinoplanes sp. NPDC023801 TaxID=3154595 RepID=UPI00340FE34A
MRLILSLSLLATIALTGPARAGGYFTAEQLAALLLTEAEVAGDHTRSGGGKGRAKDFDLFGSDACTGAEPARVPKAVTHAWVSFESNHGTTLDIEINAVGPALARRIVDDVAAVPVKCPVVPKTRHTAEHTRLPLPDLGKPAAAMVTVYRYDGLGVDQARRAVVAYGGLSLTFDEIGTVAPGQAEFIAIVKAGAEKLEGVGDPR